MVYQIGRKNFIGTDKDDFKLRPCCDLELCYGCKNVVLSHIEIYLEIENSLYNCMVHGNLDTVRVVKGVSK